ncbi:hypothetical protein [Adhaeretor mobilis]|uniref:Uncharacterized protein n=1 Tax=Adhaeretor mobilis TaxID=1930276 RepID=A0A517N1X5_9BACT|nr:hypothetical protein [Adhaeretor mobilis]QDT01141.1 hypothetical protein HG15A2_44830 [Adhaeretor mobilis]
MRRFIGRRYRLLLVAIAAIAFACLLFSTAGPFRSVVGHGVSAEQANAKLWNCLVPNGAKNVWFESGYRATRVECELSQAVFKGWCESRSWRPYVIDEQQRARVYSMSSDSPVEVRNGLRFNDRVGDLGHQGVYDAATGTAYVTYSGG